MIMESNPPLFILDLGLDIVDLEGDSLAMRVSTTICIVKIMISKFDLKSDELTGESLHENLETMDAITMSV
jgi:hypothetical protein